MIFVVDSTIDNGAVKELWKLLDSVVRRNVGRASAANCGSRAVRDWIAYSFRSRASRSSADERVGVREQARPGEAAAPDAGARPTPPPSRRLTRTSHANGAGDMASAMALFRESNHNFKHESAAATLTMHDVVEQQIRRTMIGIQIVEAHMLKQSVQVTHKGARARGTGTFANCCSILALVLPWCLLSVHSNTTCNGAVVLCEASERQRRTTLRHSAWLAFRSNRTRQQITESEAALL